jgi:hypothetical protein
MDRRTLRSKGAPMLGSLYLNIVRKYWHFAFNYQVEYSFLVEEAET